MAVALIVLASGGSSRMGEPKQLLPYRGTTLIRHALLTAIASGCDPVIAVLGAAREQILPECAGLPVEIAINDQWAEGLASAIRCGIRSVIASHPSAEAAIIALCDQPKITQELYRSFVNHYQTGTELVCCEYNNSIGVPALFARRFFPDLLALQGDRGAKQILNARRDEVRIVSFEPGAVDLDTQDDYRALLGE